MAELDQTPPATPAQGDDAPQVAAIAQYVKDLSVESPNAPAVFQWQAQPGLDVEFNISVNRVAEDVNEVELKITVGARSDQGSHFMIDLSYAGLFAFRNLPEEALPPFLLVEAPRMLFPFARQIVADAVQNAGFPPLLLDPIDFGAAYMQQMQAAQAGQPGNGAADAADADAGTGADAPAA